MFIGQKEIEKSEDSGELTPGGVKIIKVEYKDGAVEHLSDLMFEQVVTEEATTPEQLRDKRLQPVVAVVLAALREWGVKMSELGYMSALLNRSLEFNKDTALCELWAEWMPKPLSPDDVDLITVDRLLRAKTDGISNDKAGGN